MLCIAQLGPGLILVPAVTWLYWSGEAGWGTLSVPPDRELVSSSRRTEHTPVV
jgi:hypothetical protein